jgi:hypothetical protein
MAEIKGYSLWLERISGSRNKLPHPGGIRVTGFRFTDSKSGVTGGSGGGPGKAHFDGLELTAADSLAFVQLSLARDSGANLGRGRLDELMPSGCSRPVLEFESALVDWLSGPTRYPPEAAGFQMQLWVDNPRILWQQVGY